MEKNICDTAFILAAGFGRRLRPHTENIPKPMVTINNRPMIDHALDHFVAADIKRTVVNTHYRADVLHDHLARRKNPKIIISHEPEILDTGGGIKAALNHFNNRPFLVISGDSVWTEKPSEGVIKRLYGAWNSDTMDILILLQPIETMTTTHGVGDYNFTPNGGGKITRSKTQNGTHMFTSIRLNHPRIFSDTPDTPFSYLACLDRAEKHGRLYGIEHTGMWHHISTPKDLAAVRDDFK